MSVVGTLLGWATAGQSENESPPSPAPAPSPSSPPPPPAAQVFVPLFPSVIVPPPYVPLNSSNPLTMGPCQWIRRGTVCDCSIGQFMSGEDFCDDCGHPASSHSEKQPSPRVAQTPSSSGILGPTPPSTEQAFTGRLHAPYSFATFSL
jgi:hypothetical protein